MSGSISCSSLPLTSNSHLEKCGPLKNDLFYNIYISHLIEPKKLKKPSDSSFSTSESHPHLPIFIPSVSSQIILFYS